MATPMKQTFRVSLAALAVLAAAIQPRAVAQRAPTAIPVPMNSALVGDGISPLAVNACGGNATLQASSIPTTSGNGFGDNCPAAGGLLSSPQGVTVDSLEAGALDAALASLSVEQRIAVKAQLMRAGLLG